MRTGKFPLGFLIVALIVGVGAFAFWAGHASSGGSALEVKTYQPGWANVPWLDDTMPVDAALSPIADSVGAVYYLDPDEGWQRYIPGKPEVSTLTMMAFGQSYLMLFTKPVTLEVVTQPEDICDSGECSPCPTPAQCASPTPCPTTTPCPDCGEWQSLAEECVADYAQCVTDSTACASDLTWCLDALGDLPDITQVCLLIDALRFQYDLAVPILDQYSFPWLSLTFVVQDLESWSTWNCW